MIARIWHGITLTTNSDQYLEYLNQHVIPAYQEAMGNAGFFVMKEPRGDLVHFLLLSLWISEASLADFVGANLEAVNLTAEERGFLIAFESNARNYRVISEPNDTPCGLEILRAHD